jgi:hypothetical protein
MVFASRYVPHLICGSTKSTRANLNSLCAHVYGSLLEKGEEIERGKMVKKETDISVSSDKFFLKFLILDFVLKIL